MKRGLASFIFLSLLFISCATLQPQATPTPPSTTPLPDLFHTPWEDRSPFKDGLVASAQSVLDELPDASVYHIEFKIAEDMDHVSGSEEVRYTNAEDVPLDQVQMRLFPNILGGETTISNLTVDGQPANTVTIVFK